MVDLGGYVIVLVEKENKIKLFGSAAERSDCDEILEVNGNSLEHMNHEQIIQHIHQCIKTRTICLRVKRRSSGKLGSSIDSSLIDAFVIGSRAREHLQTLTKDANITPKDIAQLSKILSENNGEQELKSIKERNEDKENQLRMHDRASTSREEVIPDLRKSDSGDIDYLELNDDNMQLLNINPVPNIDLKKTDSQQSIVDLVKRSASINLSNTSLNKIIYKKEEEDEAKKYIPFNQLNTVINRLEQNLDDSNLKRLIEKTNFKTLIDIYATLMQERYINASFVEQDPAQLYQEVVELLQNKGNVEDDFIELLEILTKFEYDGLIQVMNRIIQKKRKKLSYQLDNISVTQEDSPESIKEEENDAFEDQKYVHSLIEESVSIKEEVEQEQSINEDIEQQKDFDQIELEERETNENSADNKINEEEKVDEIFKQSSEPHYSTELNQENFVCEQSRKSSLIIESTENETLQTPPPLPIEIVNGLQQGIFTPNLLIPSLATLASIMHQGISSTSPSPEFIQHQQHRSPYTPSPEPPPSLDNFIPVSSLQTPNSVLQNTFLTSVNDSLNFVNSSDLLQTPLCSFEQQTNSIYQQQQQQRPHNLSSPISSLSDKQSTNLCNLEYLNTNQTTTNLVLNSSETPIVSTGVPVIGTFDLPAQNLPSNNAQTNSALNLEQQLLNTFPTISASEYLHGQLPPTPLPPMITNLPLNNLPANTKLSIVKIEKHSSEPLGATVRNEQDGIVTIGRIVCGGAAQRCHALQEGDEILMVNNVYIRGKTVDQFCELLSQMQGTLTFVIAKRNSGQLEQDKLNVTSQANLIRKSSTSSHDSSNLPNVIHYKAFFDYSPETDKYIPCRELGVRFRKGDLLHVIDSSDNFWWQSYKEGDVNQNLAGLIPSLRFQKMREEAIKKQEQQKKEEIEAQQIEDESAESVRRGTSSILSFNCHGKRSTSKKRKIRKEELLAFDYYEPYEEMKQCMGHKRTIVFLGPNNIGRQSLRERLVKHKTLDTAIPHTSRSKRTDEKNGEDYYFVSKPQFEQYIEEDKFIEYGDYDKHYYGTSYSSIEDVLKSNRTCIVNLHVQSITKLRTPSTEEVEASPERSSRRLQYCCPT